MNEQEQSPQDAKFPTCVICGNAAIVEMRGKKHGLKNEDGEDITKFVFTKEDEIMRKCPVEKKQIKYDNYIVWRCPTKYVCVLDDSPIDGFVLVLCDWKGKPTFINEESAKKDRRIEELEVAVHHFKQSLAQERQFTKDRGIKTEIVEEMEKINEKLVQNIRNALVEKKTQ